MEGQPSTDVSAKQKPEGESIAEKQKRPPGRPRTGITPMTGVRIPAELDAKLTAWIERQPEPKPSRSEAIRRLLEMAFSVDPSSPVEPGGGSRC